MPPFKTDHEDTPLIEAGHILIHWEFLCDRTNKAGIDAINLQLILCYLCGFSLMQITVRQIKYLNNLVEQDHRSIKKITNPMLGFKALHSAEATLAGIELHHMLRKEQHVNAANQSIFEQFYALAG